MEFRHQKVQKKFCRVHKRSWTLLDSNHYPPELFRWPQPRVLFEIVEILARTPRYLNPGLNFLGSSLLQLQRNIVAIAVKRSTFAGPRQRNAHHCRHHSKATTGGEAEGEGQRKRQPRQPRQAQPKQRRRLQRQAQRMRRPTPPWHTQPKRQPHPQPTKQQPRHQPQVQPKRQPRLPLRAQRK